MRVVWNLTLLTGLILSSAPLAGAVTSPAIAAARPSPIASVKTPVGELSLPPKRAMVSIAGQLQRTGYYCIPASASIMLKSFGISRTQDHLARLMKTTTGGTTRTNTLTVLNGYLRPKGYRLRLVYSQDDPRVLLNSVALAVGVLKKPTILAVYGNRLPWSRASKSYGHAIVAYGYDATKKTITVWDPNARPSARGSHTISATSLAGVIRDLPRSNQGGVYYLSR